ncbi:hypothetical protein GCM10010254_58800 [Streptomyces chromofuscus]|nr:hypothetical protein GCM10010254_58800 [Streptomyces chromofuscus]
MITGRTREPPVALVAEWGPEKEGAMAVLQQELTLGEAADRLARALPGHRVEILQGRLTVTPPPDGSHQLALIKLGRAFDRAGIVEAGGEYVRESVSGCPRCPRTSRFLTSPSSTRTFATPTSRRTTTLRPSSGWSSK